MLRKRATNCAKSPLIGRFRSALLMQAGIIRFHSQAPRPKGCPDASERPAGHEDQCACKLWSAFMPGIIQVVSNEWWRSAYDSQHNAMTVTAMDANKFTPAEDTPDAVVDAFEALLESQGHSSIDLLSYAGALIARLRYFNREANQSTKVHRSLTADARSAMDQTHLGLQNLLYERRHLEREIRKCLEFE